MNEDGLVDIIAGFGNYDCHCYFVAPDMAGLALEQGFSIGCSSRLMDSDLQNAVSEYIDTKTLHDRVDHARSKP